MRPPVENAVGPVPVNLGGSWIRAWVIGKRWVVFDGTELVPKQLLEREDAALDGSCQ